MKKKMRLPKVRRSWSIKPQTQIVPNKKKDVGTRDEKNPKGLDHGN